MAKIRSTNTKPERLIRSALFKRGFRFRIHRKDLPGKPDIVLSKYKTAIFVHGCFWHLHNACNEGRIPKSRVEYWKPKLLRNIERDKIHLKSLQLLEWKVLVIWECEIESNLEKVIRDIISKLKIQK
jgi:DNA mismatch endonuclease (patch repair protein)